MQQSSISCFQEENQHCVQEALPVEKMHITNKQTNNTVACCLHCVVVVVFFFFLKSVEHQLPK